MKKEDIDLNNIKPDNDESSRDTKVVSDLRFINVQSIQNEEKEIKKTQLTGFQKFRMGLTILVCIVIVMGLLVGCVGLVITGNILKSSPEMTTEDFVSNESSLMYDQDGEIVTELGAYLRHNISYNDMSESLIDSVLAIEDSRYFSHFGFDIPRFLKAALSNLKSGGFGQGGSTLTMQLVKNTYFQVDSLEGGTTAAKSIERKVQEIYLAVNLNQSMDKKEIFELYLNKLNFGGNVRGIEKASQYYFGKSANELDLAQSALLAGVINAPNGYNPYYHLEDATERRNTVLDMMAYHGYITEEECELAKSIKIENELAGENASQVLALTDGGSYQSYIDVVINEAIELTGKDPSVYGMTIYTNLNRTIQDEVERIQDGVDITYPDDLMQVAMVTIENSTGAIVAVGGGRNYNTGARLLNRATSQYKQPGSSVKPMLDYALAFEYLGWSLDHVVTDKPITYPGESRVLVNFNGQYRGDVSLKDAVGTSLNIPAILTLEQVTEEIGSKKVVDYMKFLGFTHVSYEDFHYSYAIGGGTFETTCYEMAGAEAAMMNGGIYNEPHTIDHIVMQDGTVYYPQNQNQRVLSSGSAYMITRLLYNNVYGSYYNYMQILKRDYPVFAKTGTTDWGTDGLQYGIPKGAAKDKWMLASTSKYTNALWIGYDKAIDGEDCYFSSAKSSLNLPGNINKLMLDACEATSSVIPGDVDKPDDLDEITYVYGTYPYAYPEDWMDSSQLVTSTVSKTGEKELVSIYEHEASEEFNGISAKQNEDGTVTIGWSVGDGGCYGNEKDISLIDDYNNIQATGTCLFDYSWVLGNTKTYWASIYCDDVLINTIETDTGIYTDYIGDLYGNVKVCGGYTSGEVTSETKCAAFQAYTWTESW